MNKWDMERYHDKMHHRAVFTLTDGSKKEGYMQPFDQEQVAVTNLDGSGGFYIQLKDIVDVQFPDG